jgi:hypothetical protein
VFFVSEDLENGALRSVRPGPTYINDEWDMLTKEGGTVREYLVLNPDSDTFTWTTDIEEARVSAAAHYPHSEGLSQRGGILYMTSKTFLTIFALDLDSKSYTSFQTSDGALVGDGEFEQEADQLLQITDHILYMAENGGPHPGVYGRDLTTGLYFTVFQGFADTYIGDDVTGIAFTPDWKRMYACFEDSGVMLEIQREDGLPFEEP